MTKILLVDDNSQNLYLVQTLLEAKGFTVEIAANGVEALESARRSPPHIVISDILMPHMDGFALCRVWKADERLKHIPFVFYTATYTDPKDEAFALSLGADRFIVKPVDPQHFLEILAEVMRSHAAQRFSPPQPARQDENGYYREYNEALIRKLEDKMIQLQQAHERLTALYQAGIALAALKPQNELTAIALQSGCQTMNADLALYFQYDPQTDELQLTDAAAQRQKPSLSAVIPAHARDNPLGECAARRQWLTLDENASRLCRLPLTEDFASALLLPVARGEMLLGVMALFNLLPGFYEESGAKAAALLANGLAAALHNAALMEALQSSEERYRTVLETSGEAIIALDEQLRIRLWNRGAQRMFGYTCEECVGQTCDLICPPQTKERVSAALEEARRLGTLYNLLAELQTKDSRPLTAEITVTCLERSQGYTIVLRDVTEQRHADEEREKLRQQLQQAQKLDSIGRLAGGVAHDFNNLLAIILGRSEAALSRLETGDPSYPFFEEIYATARRSAELTRQLLTFARRQTVDPHVLDLNQTIQNMLRMLKRLIGEDIDLLWKPAPDPLKVKMDPAQIDQMLVNLLVNAREAIQGNGKITIETHAVTLDRSYAGAHVEASPGKYALLAVSDNGKGMNSETLQHIFEPFYTTKETQQGTGLGLATIYGIVKQQGGFVNVYSEVGQGAVFKIYLPWAEEEVETPSAAAEEPPPSGGGETILLVEDESGLLELCRENLEELGYRVLAADSPLEALRLAQQRPGEIDLLMTDIVMPEMNGRQLSEELTRQHPRLKTLYTSGYTANVIVHHNVLDAGVHFIQKPYLFRELAAKIRQALDS